MANMTGEHTPVGRPDPTEEIDAGDAPLMLDPSTPLIISAWGRKGAGKSVFNRRIKEQAANEVGFRTSPQRATRLARSSVAASQA